MSNMWLDKEEKFYDYRTSEVDGDNIFDIKKASNSDAQQILNGDKYWRDEKNTYSEIVNMTPTEYFTRCAEDCFNEPVEQLIQSRRRDKYTLEHLKEVVLKYKKRFPICYIDYATHYNPSQEGLHRMMVAGDLFGWDKEFPVQIIKWVDEERAKQEKEWKNKREIERYLRRAINNALRYKYYNIEELKDQLHSEFESEVRYVDEFENRDFELDMVNSGDKEDPGFLIIVDNSYEGFIPQDKIQWLPKNDEIDSEDLDSLDDEDLSDWMKDLLSETDSTKINESMDSTEQFLMSKELLEKLESKFGIDYYNKPLCKEVCEYIHELCNKCIILEFAIGVWKYEDYSLEPISNKGHCVIKYNNKIYDYTSGQYDDYGISPADSQPRVLSYNKEFSDAFGLDTYIDKDYVITN